MEENIKMNEIYCNFSVKTEETDNRFEETDEKIKHQNGEGNSLIKTEEFEIKDGDIRAEDLPVQNFYIKIKKENEGGNCSNIEENIYLNEISSNFSVNTEEIEIKYEETDEEEVHIENYNIEIKYLQNGEGYCKEIVTKHEEIYAEDFVVQNDCIEIKKENEGGDPSNGIKGTAEIQSEYDFNDLEQMKRTLPLANPHKCNNCKEQCEYLKTCLKNNPSQLRIYKCDKCNFVTKYRNSLSKHQLIHKDPSEVKIYKCDLCDYKSIRRRDLSVHQLTHKDPSEVPMFKCDQCTFVTKYRPYLSVHQVRHKVASQLQIYKCDKCTFTTNHKNYLRRHQSRHRDPSEVRVFECDECDYKSTQKFNLKKHQLRHKDPSEVQMYKCDECSFVTKYNSSLTKHQLSHKPEVQTCKSGECE